MRALGAARRILSSTSIVALAAIFAPERPYSEACTYQTETNTFTDVFAFAGITNCTPATGTYTASTTPPSGVTMPPGVTYTGFSFFAYGGGVINSPGVLINTTGPSNAYGAWSDGSTINFLGTATDVSTTGSSAYDFYASNGGTIALVGGKVESSGNGGFGLYASGASTITVTGTLTIHTSGAGAFGFSGTPSIQTGVLGTAAADSVVADTGGTVSLMSGGKVTTSAGGSIGLVVQGSSSTISGSGLTVQSFGDSVPPPDTGAAFNDGAGFSDAPGLSLTDSTLVASRMAAFGVYTTDGGTTALSGGSVSTAGASAPASGRVAWAGRAARLQRSWRRESP